ncbi:MAG: transcription antitermination factor NusB [Suipraeoptans sp.]
MTRKEQRELIFKIVFAREFNDEQDPDIRLEVLEETLLKADENVQSYIKDKANNIIEKLVEIDKLLNEKTTGWKTARMNKVDLSILRVAVYEILWDEDVPIKVAINEAIELSKVYSGNDGPGFINGVLAKFA